MRFRLPKRIAGVRIRRPLGRLARKLPSRGRMMLGASIATPVVLGMLSSLRRNRIAVASARPTASSDQAPAAA